MWTKIATTQYGVATYLLDNPDDYQTLPTNEGPGSAALSIQDGELYFLNSKKEWVNFGEIQGGESK